VGAGDAPSTLTAYVAPFRHGTSQTLRPRPFKTPPLPNPRLPHSANHSRNPQTNRYQHYKLGQYSSAESSYTSAISSPPPQHLLLVPLYNNRAPTRLKIGNIGGAIEDCSAVVGIVGDLRDDLH
jgi:hypothetical protein